MNAHVLAIGAATVDAPLAWLAVTLVAYVIGREAHRRAGYAAWVNPVLIAIVIVATVLLATHTSYARYRAGAQMFDLALGPATVALAVPFVLNIERVTRSAIGVGLAVLAGSVSATLLGVVIVQWLGGSREVALSIAPKAATSPIAMAVSTQIGGSPGLSAVFAILGGVVAAMTVERTLARAGIEDHRAVGLAAGVAGSGIAGAHVAALSETAAAFAALGIALNGLVTALLTPILRRWLIP